MINQTAGAAEKSGGPLFLILSGAYCASDIISEFGRLPPAFLPIGGGALYLRQTKFAQAITSRIILTIPSDFEVHAADRRELERLGLQIVRSPPSLSLASATQFILEALDVKGPLVILHGDTLVEPSSPVLLDTIVVAETDDYYPWAEIEEASSPSQTLRLRTSFGDGLNTRRVACGVFSFSDALEFRRALRHNADFISAVDAYGQHRPLSAAHAKRWFDFGSLSRMLKSRRDLLVSRAFNTVSSDGVFVTKSSKHREKIQSEILWYQNLPDALRVRTPQFFGVAPSDESQQEALGYRLEYMLQPTIADLFVFGRLPRYVWRKIISRCIEFIEICVQTRPPESDPARLMAASISQRLVVEKTIDRFNKFLAGRGLDMSSTVVLNGVETPPMSQVVEELVSCVPPTQDTHHVFMHGDFFFGNLFYDFRSDRVRAIDPRGEVEHGRPSCWGDFRYDMAKLAHSVHGLYDHLIANRLPFREVSAIEFQLDRSEAERGVGVLSDFSTMTVSGVGCLSSEIVAIEAMLFLSMLPLHEDAPQRQSALFANGLAIHRELLGKG